MLIIAFDDANLMYRQGMEHLLQQLPLEGADGDIEYQPLTKNNAKDADVVVKSFVQGEEFLCLPIFKFRNKTGMIIGLYEGDKTPYHSDLPLCISNVVFVSRKEPLSETRERVIQTWKERNEVESNQSYMKCLKCKCRKLTSQQYAIIKYMLDGKDIQDIADLLDISAKTVSAHKRMIMAKFNLNSDYELLQLFNKYKVQLSLASHL